MPASHLDGNYFRCNHAAADMSLYNGCYYVFFAVSFSKERICRDGSYTFGKRYTGSDVNIVYAACAALLFVGHSAKNSRGYLTVKF